MRRLEQVMTRVVASSPSPSPVEDRPCRLDSCPCGNGRHDTYAGREGYNPPLAHRTGAWQGPYDFVPTRQRVLIDGAPGHASARRAGLTPPAHVHENPVRPAFSAVRPRFIR